MPLRITEKDRRDRLVARHHLGRTASTVGEAVRDAVAFHSSDPASPYLASWARVDGFTSADLDQELYETRTLRRLHAMRRTLFVVPTSDSAVFDAGAGRAVAAGERERLGRWLATAMGETAASELAERLELEVMEILAGSEQRTKDLTAQVPDLRTEIIVGSGKWSGRVPMSSRLLYILAMEGKIVRARPAGSWRSSQYHWALTERWFDDLSADIPQEQGRSELLTRYLERYGPVTLTDIRWWTGWTARAAREALAAVSAPTVQLGSGKDGFIARGDTDSEQPATPAVAFLPGLDSTPMGWKERTWYLGEHGGPLFDRNGNVGPTIWRAGRIVGGWGQMAGGEVVFRLLEDIGTSGADSVAAEAGRLTEWLAGVVVTPRFRTPLEIELAEGTDQIR
jgi:hypothetical protein